MTTTNFPQNIKILFAGNSLTKGQIGESFVEKIKFDNITWEISNAGVDGDTLKNISDRLQFIISNNSMFDFIVIEAGHNDIILPQFKEKGLLFKYALQHLLRKGRQPSSKDNFRTEYLKLITYLKTKTEAKIILTTLSCINENLNSKTNQLRKEYNNIIKTIAQQANCIIADVSEEFDKILKMNNQTDYLLENFLNSVYIDKKICGKPNGSDRLSEKRNLKLTIDGIHLNKEGARVYKEIIEQTLKKLQSTAHLQ